MRTRVLILLTTFIFLASTACGNRFIERTSYAVTYRSQDAYNKDMHTITADTVGKLFAPAKKGNEQPLGDFAMLTDGKFPLIQAPDGYTVTQVTVQRAGYVEFLIANTQGRTFSIVQYLYKNGEAITSATQPFAYYPDTVKTVSAANGTVCRAGTTYPYNGEEHILYNDSVLFWWETDGYPAFISIDDTRTLPICEQFLAKMRCCYALLSDENDVTYIATVTQPSALPAPLTPPEQQNGTHRGGRKESAVMSFETIDAYVTAISGYKTNDQWYNAIKALVKKTPYYTFPDALFYDHRLTVPRFPSDVSCTDIQVTGTGYVTFTLTDSQTTVTLAHPYNYDTKRMENLLAYEKACKEQQSGYTTITDKAGNTVYRYAKTFTFPNGTVELSAAETASFVWQVNGYVWTATANSNDSFHLLNRIITELDYDVYALHVQ